MRLVRAALLLGAALLPLAATAQTARPRANTATVKPIAFTERTLANGLRVYAIRDTGTPNVSVQVWYDVGSKDDPQGPSGFAHMFEHLMFKATRNLVSEQMDRLTEDVGGYNNASTNDDYTNYYEVDPGQPPAAAAVRRGRPDGEPGRRAEELRLRARRGEGGAAPAHARAAVRQAVLASICPRSPTRRIPMRARTIGSIENLEAATIDDVRAFHATYYRPDNAVLVVVGQFRSGAARRLGRPVFRAGSSKPDRADPARDGAGARAHQGGHATPSTSRTRRCPRC